MKRKMRLIFVSVLFIIVILIVVSSYKFQKNKLSEGFLIDIETKGQTINLPVKISRKFLDQDVNLYKNNLLKTETVIVNPETFGESSLVLTINGKSNTIFAYLDSNEKNLEINVSLVEFDETKEVIKIATKVEGTFRSQNGVFLYKVIK